jgi:hypothetical protein
MATSTLRDIEAAELARRLDPITSRLWMLHGLRPAQLPADGLAAGIVVPAQALARDVEPKLPPIGVAVLLH